MENPSFMKISKGSFVYLSIESDSLLNNYFRAFPETVARKRAAHFEIFVSN